MCIIDGVTVGCPCCTVHNCKVPLENNHHHFCPQDSAQNHVSSVVGCSALTIADSHMCADLEHQEAKQLHRDWQQAHFQLKEWLQHAHVAHPSDAVAQDVNVVDLIDAEEEEEDLEIAGSNNDGDLATKNSPK